MHNTTQSIEMPPQLVETVARGSCVLFLGADADFGAADCAGPPSRAQLAAALAKKYDWVTSTDDLLRAADEYLSREPPDEHGLISFVREQVEACMTPGPIHRLLVDLGFDAIVTNGYDELAERAMKDANRRILKVVGDAEMTYAGEREAILVYLAGCASQPTSLVLTRDGQRGIVTHLSEKLRAVRGWCSLRPLLFVGWDPEDEFLGLLYYAATEALGKHKRLNYLVWANPSPRAVSAWKRSNVQVIDAAPLPFLQALQTAVRHKRLLETLPGYQPGEVVGKLPYKFLNYFEADDRDIFCGREVEGPLVFRMALAYPLLTFFGQSGVGKTSLLKAGVAPLLLAENYSYVYVRALGDPRQAIRDAVCRELKLTSCDGKTLLDFFGNALGEDRKLVVILDQFEELFTGALSSATRRDFWRELGACLGMTSPEVRFILSLREDYLAHLDEARRPPAEGEPAPVPHILRNSYRLTRLDADTAYLAIVEPARRARCTVEPLLVDVLLNHATMPGESASVSADPAEAEPPREIAAPTAETGEPAAEAPESEIGILQRLLLRLRGGKPEPVRKDGALPGRTAARSFAVPPSKNAPPARSQWSLLEADDQVPPPSLQIVMDRLYRVALARAGHTPPADDAARRGWRPPALTLTLDLYRELGGAGRILAEYVTTALQQEVPKRGGDSNLARTMLKAMVTAQKTKAALDEGELEDEVERMAPDFDPKTDQAALTAVRKALVDLRLVRSFQLGERAMYELAHDHMAAEIATWISDAELAAKAVQELLRRELDSWQRHGLLISPEALRLIHEQREALRRLTRDETELLLRSALAHGFEVSYWFQRACTAGVAAGAIALQGLASASFRTRAAAVTSLAGLGDQFTDDLLKRLADDYPQVRVAAIAALERLRPDGAWRTHLKYECYVPAGEFIMGEDKKAHRVTLGAFYIGKYPITNTEYQRFMADRGRGFEMPAGEERHPVTSVDWYSAKEYAEWAGMRLLTEAEWEKAASWETGGKVTRWQGDKVTGKKRTYPWGDKFDKRRCNTNESGIGTTTPVGKYSPALHPELVEGGDSPCGCAYMAGNVWEWCSSKYKDYPYRADDGRENLTEYASRVMRGGSFRDDVTFARCAARRRNSQNYRDEHHGLRVGWAAPSASGL